MRRFFSFVITVLIAGAIGFGLGAYVAPTDKAVQFRALVDGKIAAMKKAIHRVGDKSKSEPKETQRETAPAKTTPCRGRDASQGSRTGRHRPSPKRRRFRMWPCQPELRGRISSLRRVSSRRFQKRSRGTQEFRG